MGAMLRVRGRFTDSDVVDVTKLAMAGLVQTAEEHPIYPHAGISGRLD